MQYNNDARIDLTNGSVNTGEIVREFVDLKNDTVPFKEIGFGKPLTVLIRHINTVLFSKIPTEI